MTKAQKIKQKLNEQFRNLLKSRMKKRYRITVETEWNLFAMRLVTTKKDGTRFTSEQLNFIKAYSDGYADAMKLVE